MNVKDNINRQKNRLKEICTSKNLDFTALESLLESVRTKKIKRINYHQQKIAEVIEKNIK
jgi:hypothetical protein